ncbi:MAG: hypothetical protein OXF44_03830 [Anaerolineaceae bacterium]|nr:hypothetical protein [Anaerolineaceae bacterium]
MPQSAAAHVHIDVRRVISPVSPLLFSGFAEHMGRCIYGGIYEPGSPRADENGLRRDVLAALRELNFRSIRYPGGNFLSGYRWEDGVGPRELRPRRRDLAWQSVESNQFGTDDFIDFCRQIDSEPMLGVNMGTGSIQDAANLVEYCNARQGTKYADMRVANGYKDPHAVRYWCIGNEMDGPWQIGHLEAEEYGRKALEAAKMMRWHDPDIKLVLCGSSSSAMPTYPEWDRIALEHCYEHVNFHSMHYYAANRDDDTDSYLATAVGLEDYVATLEGVLRYVKAKARSKRNVFLSWDEWNIWYKAQQMQGGWKEAPRLIEEVYNLEDALVAAQWLNVFLRRADVLKIACLAQIVNVIAPILTETDALLKQSIYYPFLLFSRLASGNSLDVRVEAPRHETQQYGDVPLLDVSATHDPESRLGALFLVNRSQSEAVPLRFHWQNVRPRNARAWQMRGRDPKAANSFDEPNRVMARPLPVQSVETGSELLLPPLSFTALEMMLR